jgi:hypothetical protein
LVTPPPDLIELFIRPLERVGVEYMITGGVAAVIYGDPRFTRDVDLVVELDAAAVSDLLAAFDRGEFYLPPAEVVSEEARRSEGGHFNIIHHDSALRADVYTAGEVVLHRWALDRVGGSGSGQGKSPSHRSNTSSSASFSTTGIRAPTGTCGTSP